MKYPDTTASLSETATRPAAVRIAAVVVTYNRCEMLLRCIEHLQAQEGLPQDTPTPERILKGTPVQEGSSNSNTANNGATTNGNDALQPTDTYTLDIVVIDNASTDSTAECLAALPEFNRTIHYIHTGANLGGAGGFAFGMNYAVQAGYDYLWLMDDDCLPDPGALRALIDARTTINEQANAAPQIPNTQPPATQPPTAQADSHVSATQPPATQTPNTQPPATQPPAAQAKDCWGYLSSVVRWTDDTPCAMNIQRHPLFKNIEDFSPALQPCTLASFVSLFVPTWVVQHVGLPYAEFFIWTDDWEFTRRVSREFPSYVVGTSTVVHASATNNPGNIFTDPPERLDRYQYIYRNDVVLYREEGLRGVTFLFARGIYHTLRVLLSRVGQKGTRIASIWKGTIAGFSFYPTRKYPTPDTHNE